MKPIHGVVAVDNLKLTRDATLSDEKIIGVLKKNDEVDIQAKEGDFYLIHHDRSFAYVPESSIKLQ